MPKIVKSLAADRFILNLMSNFNALFGYQM